MTPRPSSRLARFGLLAAVLAGPLTGFGAVGELWVAETPSGQTLQMQVFQSPAELSAGARLTYEIGFSTREHVDLGALFDSITITLARANGEDAFNIVTGDAFGLTGTFPTGGLLSGGGGVSAEMISPRIFLLENATATFAARIEVTLPPTLSGSELQTIFSFFDNGDDAASRGYAILVPEPSTPVLLALVGLGLLSRRWKRRARS